MRSIVLLVVLALGCSRPHDAADLRSLMEELCDAIHTRDRAKVARISRSLVPTRETLKLALRPDVDDKLRERLLEEYEAWEDRPERTFVIDRDQTEVTVKEWVSDGDRKLRDGLQMYTVRFVRPGEKSGMKYHRFIWDGRAWKMLGKLRGY